jgi:NDP-sugar pyrophosphorylase family protein
MKKNIFHIQKGLKGYYIMKKTVKNFFLKVFTFLFARNYILYVEKKNYNVDIKWLLQIWFFQRILRINSHMPFPMHWTTYFGKSGYFKYPEGEVPVIGLAGCCYIQTIGGIEIGKNVIMGMGSKIISANHDIYDFSKHIKKSVKIGNNVWIGANVVILPGVEIGDNTIIGCLLYTSPSPRDGLLSRMPSSA